MKKMLVINGANLNMLGIRERELYGNEDYAALKKYIKKCAKELSVKVKTLQFNGEGEIVSAIQRAYGKYDGIVLNAGAYTHTSIAILDALKAVGIPTAEVHLTRISDREEFRRFSYVKMYAQFFVDGKGFEGYKDALRYLAEH